MLSAIPAALIAQSNDIAIIPRPVSLTRGNGSFSVTPRTRIFADRADSAVAVRFSRSLAPATGFALPVYVGRGTSGNRIVFQRAPASESAIG